MVYKRIGKVLRRWQEHREILPQSSLGRAISYTLKQWSMLGVYLDDPDLEIDNNLVENAIRPTAVGKKNWLFFGERHVGQRSAILNTIIGNCYRHGIEPSVYLRDVLSRLPSMTNWQIKDIVPAAWAKAHQQTLKAA
jgi:transposase